MKKGELTQSILKEYLTYDPITGIFNAKHSARGGFFPAGRELGSLADGYKLIQVNSITFKSHRLAFLYVHGYLPELPLMLDHIDRNKTNNAISNLRVVNSSENVRNVGLQTNNTSGHTGVHFHKRSSKWEACIRIKGIRKYLGGYKNKKDAIAAKKQAEIKYNYYEVKERVA